MFTQSKTVLMVEDDEANMRLAEALLEMQGLRVLKAFNAEECFRVLESCVPDLVLLDINLPEVDGFTIFKRIRGEQRTAGVKVVALTALAMRDEQEKIWAAGFDSYISKPIDNRSFIDQVKDLLGIGETVCV